jgi:ABC-type multidrug transport system ATPase subunit
MVFFLIFGSFVFSLNLFRETSFLLIFVTLFVWGFAQIGLAYFFQAFLSNARTTSVIGYMIAFWLILIGTCLNLAMFVLPKEAPYLLNLFPSFGISRIFYYMASFCAYDTCISEFSRVSREIKFALAYLTLGGIILIILGIYLYEVLPRKYGIRKGPFFCIEELIKKCYKKKQNNELLIEENTNQEKLDKLIEDDSSKDKKENLTITENNDINTNTNINKEEEINNNINENNETKDEEVLNEYKIVKELIDKGENELRKYPLVCTGLTKIYDVNKKSKDPKKRNKKSLNDFTIHLNDSEIFGLLGPNGAGKTTFFSILTGIYESTSGNAYIRGNSILKNIEKTYQYIGYCPQFDLLWEDLSVENTLLFYSRMKNSGTNKVNSMVEKILDDVKLKKFRNYLVRELSGGMRRRLSLGVALVGEPPIVFLDEPTTGLDPKNKREIWDILSHCKQNRCMILTTHLMDEAETLCDRIGIILKGKIRCLGSQYKLKNNYGKGFKLCINLKPFKVESNKKNDDDIIIDDRDEKIGFFFDKEKIKEQNRINEKRISKISSFLNEIFTKNCKLVEKHRSAAIYEIGTDVFNPEILFQRLEERKEELEITNWAISQVDLEDIFIKLTENDL